MKKITKQSAVSIYVKTSFTTKKAIKKKTLNTVSCAVKAAVSALEINVCGDQCALSGMICVL